MKIKHRMTQAEVDHWFAEFHADHPDYYKAFVKLANEIKFEGHRRYGAQTIMERLRWESRVRDGSENYKLANPIKNRLAARFSRKLMSEDPRFRGFFRVTNLKTTYVQTEQAGAEMMG